MLHAPISSANINNKQMVRQNILIVIYIDKKFILYGYLNQQPANMNVTVEVLAWIERVTSRPGVQNPTIVLSFFKNNLKENLLNKMFYQFVE